MSHPSPPTHASKFWFSNFEIDAKDMELRKEGVRIRLQDQPFRILLILMERPGELVTREELRDRVWAAETFVEFEHSLNTSINKLRRALNDSAGQPRYIETVPRRGYRFIGELQTVPAMTPVSEPAPVAKPRSWAWAMVALLAVGISAAGLWRWTRPVPANLLQSVPLTSYPGVEAHPSFSPDGTQIAFAWNGPKEDNTDVYVKLAGSGEPRRLTTAPEMDDVPAWSPDGRSIAFVRRHPALRQGEVYVISPLGGTERKVGETAFLDMVLGPTLAWTSDSKWLAVRDDASVDRPQGLYLLSPQTGERKLLLPSPAGATLADYGAAFSPDGQRLAFSRSGRLTVVALDGLTIKGEPRQLTQPTSALEFGPVWSVDQQEILFVRWMGLGASTLWRIRADGKAEASPIPTTASTEIGQPAIAPTAGRLAFTERAYRSNIWRIPLRADHTSAASPQRIIASSRFDGTMAISPKGDRIAFCSSRSGSTQIWLAAHDGANPVPLTNHPGGLVGTPRWSPDGQLIAYDAFVDGALDVYVIPATGGASRRLTDHASDRVPAWSADGRWIYFSSNRGGSRYIWKKPFQGGEAIRVTQDTGNAARESPDGRHFCYFSQRPAALWTMPVRDGLPDENARRRVSDSASMHIFHVSNSGIYFAEQTRYGDAYHRPTPGVIYFYEFATGRTRTVVETSKPLSMGLAIAPDESWLLYSQVDSVAADLMLIEKFR